MTTPDVAICIPAYRSADFVHNAIESALGQEGVAAKVIVSVDPGGDGTDAACLKYASDPRVSVHVNPCRLGWTGNVNACLDRVDVPFFGFCFHDDALTPTWAASLRAALLAEPSASAACGLIERSDDADGHRRVLPKTEVRGAVADRILKLLSDSTSAYDLKGMMRSDLIHAGLRLPDLPASGFQADWVMMFAYALRGECIGVPRVLYRKRLWSGSVTAGWTGADPDELVRAEAEIKALMAAMTRDDPSLSVADRTRIYQAILARPALSALQAKQNEDLALIAKAEEDWLGVGLAALLERLLTDVAPSEPPAPDPVAQSKRGRALYQSASRAAAAGDIVTAVYELRRAVRIAPEDAQASRRLAKLLNQPGTRPFARAGEIAECLERALALEPRWDDWLFLARVRKREGDHAGAVAAAREAVRIAPEDEPRPQAVLARFSKPDSG